MVVAGEAFAVESGASHSKLLFTWIHCVVCIVTMWLPLFELLLQAAAWIPPFSCDLLACPPQVSL